MRTCGQCGMEMVRCLTRQKEHLRFECEEGRMAWNAAVIAEGPLTSKKIIKRAKSRFKVTKF